MAPLAIDLFCGLGGWTEGLLAEGYDVIGFDIERHRYPARALPDAGMRKIAEDGVDFNNKADSRKRSFNYANECAVREAPLTGGWIEYPAQLVIQDVLTLHGSQFRGADLIVASPPCQAYSYRAMPWSRAKALPPPDNTLFEACFRIQREACAAAGRYIPMVVENVRGAQKWVGRSRWNYGSFHLWGDVPALMPMTQRGAILKEQPYKRRHGTGSWFAIDMKSARAGITDPKQIAHNTTSGHGRNQDGRKGKGSGGAAWFDANLCVHGSRSSARKAASAMIAKIPFDLARHIAAYWKPRSEAA
jgi:hypothetical protein